jgi:rubrerythrin
MIKKDKQKAPVINNEQKSKYECPNCGYIAFGIIKCPICGDALIKKMIKFA